MEMPVLRPLRALSVTIFHFRGHPSPAAAGREEGLGPGFPPPATSAPLSWSASDTLLFAEVCGCQKGDSKKWYLLWFICHLKKTSVG